MRGKSSSALVFRRRRRRRALFLTNENLLHQHLPQPREYPHLPPSVCTCHIYSPPTQGCHRPQPTSPLSCRPISRRPIYARHPFCDHRLDDCLLDVSLGVRCRSEAIRWSRVLPPLPTFRQIPFGPSVGHRQNCDVQYMRRLSQPLLPSTLFPRNPHVRP